MEHQASREILVLEEIGVNKDPQDQREKAGMVEMEHRVSKEIAD